ncbi:MAG: hypothetical protein RL441_741 [Actinomycetota bacterium]|jgi:hypothetical protein
MSTLRSKMKMFVSPVAALAMVVSGLAVFAAAPASAATRTLTIHYNRTAGDYTGWNLWTWNDVTTAGQAYFTADDAFGKVAVLDVKADGVSAGFLFRSTEDWGTAVKDEANGNGDRLVTLNPFGNTEVWLLQGDATAYDYNPQGRAIRIHYKRTADDYAGWNLWTWADTLNNGQAYFTGKDAFGAIATIPVKADGAGVGFLFRSTEDWGTAVKDEANGNGDRAATLVDGPLTEIWMLQGDATAYTTDPSIVVKTNQTIRSFTKKTVKAGKWVTFPMLTTDGTKVKWKSLTPGKCKVVGRNRIVGVKAGVCKLTATAPGAATLNPMAAFPYSITVKK